MPLQKCLQTALCKGKSRQKQGNGQNKVTERFRQVFSLLAVVGITNLKEELIFRRNPYGAFSLQNLRRL
jgi:hypothetical protein